MKRTKDVEKLAAVLLTLIMATLVMTPSTSAQSKFITLHEFSGGSDGGNAQGSVIFDTAGNLYGTTFEGGNSHCGCGGVVFQLTPRSDGRWTETVLHVFGRGNDGAGPRAGLIFDAAGNLYGTTAFGGVPNLGTVFELTPNADGSWSEKVLYSFTGESDGASPFAGLTFDQAGNLYGTTLGGGTGGTPAGTVFELTPNADGSWSERIIHSFTREIDGDGPRGDLVFDESGNLYGTTSLGGASEAGTVFELTPNTDGSWSETLLHVFTGGNDGNGPTADLIFDAAGNLYGTTVLGGAGNNGVVFQLKKNASGSWEEKILHHFTGSRDGGLPFAGLTFDRSGALYSTASAGGANGFGVAFRLALNSKDRWHETVLHAFRNHPGAVSYAGVIFDAAGNLYGTTSGNGENTGTFGSVFRITP